MIKFNFFSKKKHSYQPSEYFLNHPLKDKYFYRLMPFSMLQNNIVAAYDPNSPRIISFDPWPQQIFLNATGNITINQFLDTMASMYSGKIPELLDRTIIDEAEKLIKERCIAIADEQIELATEFLLPRKIKQ